MKLQTCLEIGENCELETVGEALYNIQLHSGNLFAYSEITNELNELQNDFEQSGITKDTGIAEAVKLLSHAYKNVKGL